MATANETYEYTATGDWYLVASDGDVHITSDDQFHWALTATTSEPAFDKGHPFDVHSRRDYRKSIALEAGQYFWVKCAPLSLCKITAQDPAS